MPGVPTTNSFNTHNADNVTTVFPFTFFAYNTSIIKVYTIDGNADPVDVTGSVTISLNSSLLGGSVTFSPAPSSPKKVLIRREAPYTQQVEFSDLARYKETSIELGLNVLELQIQQLKDLVASAVKFQLSSGITDARISAAVDGAVLMFSGITGLIVPGPNANQIAAAQGYATAAQSSAANAASQANAAQGYANAAAATLASALWRDVVFLTFANSPYTMTQADNGKLFRIDTSGGNFVFNLAQISTLSMPFSIGIKKETSDANSVTINRAGTDTIGGATNKVINIASAGATLIADTDPAPDQWTAADFGPFSIASLPAATYFNATTDLIAAIVNGTQSKVSADLIVSNLNYNGLINGGMALNQRFKGSTAEFTNTNQYTLDRWLGYAGTGTTAQITRVNSGGSAISETAIRVQRKAANAGTDFICATQVMESRQSWRFRGRKCAVRFRAAKGANFSGASIVMQVYYGFGTDQSGASMMANGWTTQTLVIDYRPVPTATFDLYEAVFDIPANATQIGMLIGFYGVGVAGAADYLDITDLYFGEPAGKFVMDDMALLIAKCQRFYEEGGYVSNQIPLGAVKTATAANWQSTQIRYAVTKRISSPTITIANAVRLTGSPAAASVTQTGFVPSLATDSTDGFHLIDTGTSGSGNFVGYSLFNGSGPSWTASAEL